jgi:hypothetical protein
VSEYPPTPELDKQHAAIEDGAHKIGEFLDWLAQNGYHVAQFSEADDCLYLPGVGAQRLIAGFYGIDLDTIEQERRAILAHLRGDPLPEGIKVRELEEKL